MEEVSGVLALLAVVLQRQRAPIHIRRAAAVAHIQTDTVANSQLFYIQRTGIIDRGTIVSTRARLYACTFNGGRSGLTHAHQLGITIISLYGNISQRCIGGIRHDDAMNSVKRDLIQLHLCGSVAADCVAQEGVRRQGGKGDIGEVRCSIVEFKATPADCEITAGYVDDLFVAHGGERAYQPRRTRHVGEHRTCTVVDHGDLLDVHRTVVDDGGRGAVVSHSAEAFISRWNLRTYSAAFVLNEPMGIWIRGAR